MHWHSGYLKLYYSICDFSTCQTYQRWAKLCSESICNSACSRNPWQAYLNIRTCIYIHRLQGTVPAHEALRLAVNTRAGHRPDVRPEWKRPRGRPPTNLDPPVDRCRARFRCCLGHGQWSRRLEGSTTRRRSSGPVSEHFRHANKCANTQLYSSNDRKSTFHSCFSRFLLVSFHMCEAASI